MVLPALLRTFLPLALFCFCACIAVGQTVITVTIETANDTHPNPNPYHEVYALDGVQGRELTLERGKSYGFKMDGVSGQHPFYLTTSASGGGAEPFNIGVTGNVASGDDTLFFSPSPATPSLLYYGCYTHQWMGWRINVVDAQSAVERGPVPLEITVLPNPAREAINLTLPRGGDLQIRLLNARGAEVARLFSGSVREGSPLHLTLPQALPAGHYTVRIDAAEWRAARQVTLLR